MSANGSDRLKENLRRYLDAGVSLGKRNSKEIEGLIKELFDRESAGRERLEDSFEEFRARSRRGVELISELVRSEVRREFDVVSKKRRDEMLDLFERGLGLVEEFLGRDKSHSSRAKDASSASGLETGSETKSPSKRPARKTPAKKATAKKAPAKKAAAPRRSPRSSD